MRSVRGSLLGTAVKSPGGGWMTEQLIEKALSPAVTAVIGIIAVLNTWLILRKTNRFQAAQAERARTFQREETERAQAFQRAQAGDALRLQQAHADKATVVDKHAQAYTRWRQLLFFKHTTGQADGWADFMNEMQDWLAANTLYLTEGAAKAFAEAITNRVVMDTVGDHSATAHHRSEAFKRLEAAGPAILANSPRYGGRGSNAPIAEMPSGEPTARPAFIVEP